MRVTIRLASYFRASIGDNISHRLFRVIYTNHPIDQHKTETSFNTSVRRTNHRHLLPRISYTNSPNEKDKTTPRLMKELKTTVIQRPGCHVKARFILPPKRISERLMTGLVLARNWPVVTNIWKRRNLQVLFECSFEVEQNRNNQVFTRINPLWPNESIKQEKFGSLIKYSLRMLVNLSALAKWPCLTEEDTSLLFIGSSSAVIDTAQTAVWLSKVVCQTLDWSCVIGQGLSPSLHSCTKNLTKQQQWINHRERVSSAQIPLLSALKRLELLSFAQTWNHNRSVPTLSSKSLSEQLLDQHRV